MKILHQKLLTISKTQKYIHNDIDFIIIEAEKQCNTLNIIYDYIKYKNYDTMSSYLYVIITTVFFNMLFYIDDIYGEDITSKCSKLDIKIIIDIWKNGKINKEKEFLQLNDLFESMLYLRNIILEKSNIYFFERLTNYLIEHIKHTLIPKKYFNLTYYIDTRKHFGGMYPTLIMIEFVYECYLNKETIKKVSELNNIVAKIGALSNDIFSYPKEKHSDFNLINVLVKIKKAKNINESIYKSIKL